MTRDRYVDFLRAFAICMVVLGHWTITALVRQDGTIQAPELLATIRWTQWLTLGFQIMPLFFLAGGYAAAGSWERHQESGVGAARWLRGRTLRLLLPTTAYVTLVLAAIAVCMAVGVDPGTLAMVGWAMAMQLWFLPVYLILSAVTPLLYEAHRRWGLRVTAALGVAGVAVDIAVVSGHIPVLGLLNYILIWGSVYQLGFCWRDGMLTRGMLVGLAGSGALAFAALIGYGPFPPSLIYVTGERISNTSPPSVAMLAYAMAQTGLCVLAAPAMTRLLRREKLWRVVGPAGQITMTVYLWHMLPVIIAAVALYLTGLAPEPALGSAGWWALRPVWLALLAIILAAVLVALRPLGRGLLRCYDWAVSDIAGPQPLALWSGMACIVPPLSRWAIHGFAYHGRFPTTEALSFGLGALLVIAIKGRTAPTRTALQTSQLSIKPLDG